MIRYKTCNKSTVRSLHNAAVVSVDISLRQQLVRRSRVFHVEEPVFNWEPVVGDRLLPLQAQAVVDARGSHKMNPLQTQPWCVRWFGVTSWPGRWYVRFMHRWAFSPDPARSLPSHRRRSRPCSRSRRSAANRHTTARLCSRSRSSSSWSRSVHSDASIWSSPRWKSLETCLVWEPWGKRSCSQPRNLRQSISHVKYYYTAHRTVEVYYRIDSDFVVWDTRIQRIMGRGGRNVLRSSTFLFLNLGPQNLETL